MSSVLFALHDEFPLSFHSSRGRLNGTNTVGGGPQKAGVSLLRSWALGASVEVVVDGNL